MAKQFTLGRNERLKSRKQIDALFLEGKKFTVPPFRVHFITTANDGAALRFGIGASSKVFRKAVDRNRVKRLARETWRLQKNELQQAVITANLSLRVFVVYTARELPEYEIMLKQMKTVIHKLQQLLAKPD